MTRVGVVVPPANPAAEPEFWRLLDRQADLHVTRFPVPPDLSLAARLASYNDVLPDMIRSFGGLPLDALVMACTGSRYLPYEVTTDELVTQVEKAGATRDGVLLLTGTGMSTLRAIDKLSEGNERTVLTSNLCGAWWALTSAGKYASLERAEDGEKVAV